MDENVTTGSTSLSLSDEQLAADYPAVSKLVTKLDDIAKRTPAPELAAALAAFGEYFRTPDAA